jgi:hypothetical protein
LAAGRPNPDYHPSRALLALTDMKPRGKGELAFSEAAFVNCSYKSEQMIPGKNHGQKTLRELFLDTLKDIYFAEKKILGALPKMTKAAQARDLKAAFQKHEAETKEHVARLDVYYEQCFCSIMNKCAHGFVPKNSMEPRGRQD